MIALWFAALAQDYSFPTSDQDYVHFYPTAYYDHAGTDWNCGGITYSGHRGSDFGVGSWTGMDDGRDVVAAAPGEVVYVHDGEFDRCTTGTCAGGGGFGNYVQIQHADGKSTYYAHLKQGTVAVAAGQQVVCGQHLGLVGSSGYSTGPHLHFEVRLSGGRYDPFDGPCSGPPTWWVDQGAYDALPGRTCGDPVCNPATPLTCGQSITTANDTGPFTQTLASYACTSFTYTGPERAFSFTPTLSEPVTLRLTGLSADLDLFALGPGACVGAACTGASTGSASSDEAVTFTAVAGQPVNIVVDGYDGAVSGFTLTAECTPPGCHGSLPAGHDDYCTASCTCAAAQGDCDGTVTCDPGLVCTNDVGAAWGFSAITDVCLPPATCADDPAEPDDAVADATPVPADATLTGRLCPLDEDWFALPMNTGDTVDLTLALQHADADLELYLYDDQGLLVAASETATDLEAVQGTATAPGLWHARVAMYAEGPTGAGGGDWTLSVAWTRALRLDVTPLQAGQPGAFSVVGAPPGADVAFAWSPGAEAPGPCLPALGGLCTDLPRPRLLFRTTADATGAAEVAVVVPRTVTGTVSFQAFVIDGAQSAKTAPVTRTIAPP